MLSSSRIKPTNPILLSEIKAYIELFNIEEPQLFIRMIKAADNTFIDHAYQQLEKSRRKK